MARRLRAVQSTVNTETGEIIECEACKERDDEIAGLETELRSWRARYAKLKRDRRKEAEGSKWWGLAIALFTEWRIATGHMRSLWTVDRFEVCLPYLETYGYHACRYAVWGLAANHYERQVTPAYTKHYDEFWRAFKNADDFEGYVNAGRAIFGDELPVELPPE